MTLRILHPFLGTDSPTAIATIFANLSVVAELGGPGRFAWKHDNDFDFSVAGMTVGTSAHTGTVSTRFRTAGPLSSFTGIGRRIVSARAHNGTNRTLLYHAMLGSDGLVRIVEGGTAVATSSIDIDLDTDYVVQLQVVPGNNQPVTCRIYDETGTSLLEAFSVNRNTLQNPGNAEFSVGHTPPGSAGQEITSWWWDTVHEDNGSWPDPTRSFFLAFPNGDGTDTDSGAGSASTIDDLLDNLGPVGDQVVEVNSGSRRSFAITNPLGAGMQASEIDFIFASALLGSGGGTGAEGRLYFGDGTNRDFGPSAAPGAGTLYNGHISTLAPDGGALDWSTIEDLEIGVEETASPGGGQVLEIEHAVVGLWARAISAGTPVEATLSLPYEALGTIEASLAKAYESAQPIEATRAAAWESIAPTEQSQTIAYEALQPIEASRSSAYESLAAVERSSAIAYESLAEVARAIAKPWESAGVLEATLQAAYEALGSVWRTLPIPWEAEGSGTIVEALLVAAWESAGVVEQLQSIDYEALGRVEQALAIAWEADGVAAPVVVHALRALRVRLFPTVRGNLSLTPTVRGNVRLVPHDD